LRKHSVARLIALGTVTMRRDWVSAQPSPNALEREPRMQFTD